MTNPVQTMGLFPEPVSRYLVWADSWQAQLEAVATEQKPGQNHAYSISDQVLDSMPTLKKTILDCCQNFSEDILGIRDQLRITQSWINRYNTGDTIHQHHHPNSLVSATWYWQMPETGEIQFHKHALNSAHTWQMKFDRDPTTSSGFATQIVSIRVEQGDLLIWPSYLVHGVPEWPGTEPRCSLSVNLLPEHWGSGLYKV